MELYIYICMTYIHTSEFLISSYGAPLAQRGSYLILRSSLFGPDSVVNYDYILYLGQTVQLIMIIFLLTALTVC